MRGIKELHWTVQSKVGCIHQTKCTPAFPWSRQCSLRAYKCHLAAHGTRQEAGKHIPPCTKPGKVVIYETYGCLAPLSARQLLTTLHHVMQGGQCANICRVAANGAMQQISVETTPCTTWHKAAICHAYAALYRTWQHRSLAFKPSNACHMYGCKHSVCLPCAMWGKVGFVITNLTCHHMMQGGQHWNIAHMCNV